MIDKEDISTSNQQRLDQLEGKVDCISNDVKHLKHQLEPVIEVWSTLSGFVGVLRWVGIAAKWVAVIVGAILAVVSLGIYKKSGG